MRLRKVISPIFYKTNSNINWHYNARKKKHVSNLSFNPNAVVVTGLVVNEVEGVTMAGNQETEGTPPLSLQQLRNRDLGVSYFTRLRSRLFFWN